MSKAELEQLPAIETAGARPRRLEQPIAPTAPATGEASPRRPASVATRWRPLPTGPTSARHAGHRREQVDRRRSTVRTMLRLGEISDVRLRQDRRYRGRRGRCRRLPWHGREAGGASGSIRSKSATTQNGNVVCDGRRHPGAARQRTDLRRAGASRSHCSIRAAAKRLRRPAGHSGGLFFAVTRRLQLPCGPPRACRDAGSSSSPEPRTPSRHARARNRRRGPCRAAASTRRASPRP